MDSSADLISSVARLWRMYKKQEFLYRSAMRLEISCKFRRLLGNGYMIALLCKKEIGSVYEDVKCNLSDGELSSITRSDDDFASDEKPHYAKLITTLISGQASIVDGYQSILVDFERDSETALICKEHLILLNQLNDRFADAWQEVGLEETEIYTFVA